MSDLSFLIENQNEVQIDQSLLEKYKHTNDQDLKQPLSNISKVISSRDIKLNRNKNLITTKKKAGSPRSFNIPHRAQEQPQGEQLAKLSMRVEALEENQKRMEKRIGIQFFQLKEQIQKRNLEQSDQFQEVKRLKGSLKQTKRNIAQLLSLISKRK